jgi:hypothetical protein
MPSLSGKTALSPVGSRLRRDAAPGVVVGPGGFEPPTSRLSSARSNQLSYEP